MRRAMAMRAMAGAHVLLGLASAAFAFHSLAHWFSLSPQAGGQGAPTAAQVVYAREAAVLMLQTGAGQRAAAVAAGMFAEAGAGGGPARWLLAFGTFLGAFNAYCLYHVASGVAADAVRTCLSQAFRALLVASYVLAATPLCLLLLVGFAIVLLD